MSITDLINSAEKYAPIAKFLLDNRAKVADEIATGTAAVEAVNKTDPTIIPHLEKLTSDLIAAAGDTKVPRGAYPTRVAAAQHIAVRAMVAPETLSPDEKRWMDRASQSG